MVATGHISLTQNTLIYFCGWASVRYRQSATALPRPST